MLIPGTSELLIIFGALLLLFGGRKLPQLGGALGESIRNFKKGLSGPEGETRLPEAKKESEPNTKV